MPTPITNFYTLAGLDNVYTDYNSANQETVQKGIRNIYPVSFTVKADAEAFRSGQWDTYLSNHYAHFETDADAVIYADGSNYKNERGGYGILIFLRSGEIICESASLIDLENGTFLSKRYDIDGNLTEEKNVCYPILNGAKKGFVESSWNESGEPEGARRALEICFKEKGVQKAVLVYDSETIEKRYLAGTVFTTTKPEHPTYFYGQLCEEIKKNYGEQAVRFIHVDSHRNKKDAEPYRIDEKEFIHAIFNDLVDAMAKAEACIGEVSGQENINLLHAIPETKNFKIQTRDMAKKEASRDKTRSHLHAVLSKEWLRPFFQ